MSPTRAAGIPPISTVGQPGGTIADGGCTAGGGNEQTCGVPTVAAGIPPMSTVGHAGRPDDARVAGRVAHAGCWWHRLLLLVLLS